MILYHGTNQDIETDKYLDQQYYFGTDQALCFLHKTSVEIV